MIVLIIPLPSTSIAFEAIVITAIVPTDAAKDLKIAPAFAPMEDVCWREFLYLSNAVPADIAAFSLFSRPFIQLLKLASFIVFPLKASNKLPSKSTDPNRFFTSSETVFLAFLLLKKSEKTDENESAFLS